jgi:hypothetical protein
MFETAVQEKRTGILWGVVVGYIAFVALLGTATCSSRNAVDRYPDPGSLYTSAKLSSCPSGSVI